MKYLEAFLQQQESGEHLGSGTCKTNRSPPMVVVVKRTDGTDQRQSIVSRLWAAAHSEIEAAGYPSDCRQVMERIDPGMLEQWDAAEFAAEDGSRLFVAGEVDQAALEKRMRSWVAAVLATVHLFERCCHDCGTAPVALITTETGRYCRRCIGNEQTKGIS